MNSTLPDIIKNSIIKYRLREPIKKFAGLYAIIGGP